MVLSIDPTTGGTVFVPFINTDPEVDPYDQYYVRKPNYTMWGIYVVLGTLVLLGIIRLTLKK